MVGLLSGLSSWGLSNLESVDIYEKPNVSKQKELPKGAVINKMLEKDYLFEKSYVCPVCDTKFTSKTVKTGKAKLIHTDLDLRPRYEGIDVLKYDVVMCPICGFSSLSRHFVGMGSLQTKLVKEKICCKVKLHEFKGDTYTYEEAIERYKMALACAVVKLAKPSEKAYICLKIGWLVRGYMESLLESGTENKEKIDELKENENAYLNSAYEGFIEAMKTETFPLCGMDEMTINYLLAVLARRFKKYDVASRMISSILTSRSANSRTKDKTRELKELLIQDLKKGL